MESMRFLFSTSWKHSPLITIFAILLLLWQPIRANSAVFGPQTFNPFPPSNRETVDFDVATPTGGYALKISNAPESTAAGLYQMNCTEYCAIDLNGEPVVFQNDFSGNSLRQSFPFVLRVRNQLSVDMSSLPGCAVTVEIIPAGNVPPVANAGPDQTVNLGDWVSLDGSGSTDLDGDVLSYT